MCSRHVRDGASVAVQVLHGQLVGTMRINQNTQLSGEKVVLVPYRQEHVPRYHGWMVSSSFLPIGSSCFACFLQRLAHKCVMHVQEDSILREATASERLTLEVRFTTLQTKPKPPRIL